MSATKPSVYDAIMACMEQIKDIEFKPKVIYMHPVDYRYMKVNKVIYLVKAQIKRNKRLRHKRK